MNFEKESVKGCETEINTGIGIIHTAGEGLCLTLTHLHGLLFSYRVV